MEERLLPQDGAPPSAAAARAPPPLHTGRDVESGSSGAPTPDLHYSVLRTTASEPTNTTAVIAYPLTGPQLSRYPQPPASSSTAGSGGSGGVVQVQVASPAVPGSAGSSALTGTVVTIPRQGPRPPARHHGNTNRSHRRQRTAPPRQIRRVERRRMPVPRVERRRMRCDKDTSDALMVMGNCFTILLAVAGCTAGIWGLWQSNESCVVGLCSLIMLAALVAIVLIQACRDMKVACGIAGCGGCIAVLFLLFWLQSALQCPCSVEWLQPIFGIGAQPMMPGAFAISGTVNVTYSGIYISTEKTCQGVPVYQRADNSHLVFFRPEDTGRVWMVNHAERAASCSGGGAYAWQTDCDCKGCMFSQADCDNDPTRAPEKDKTPLWTEVGPGEGRGGEVFNVNPSLRVATTSGYTERARHADGRNLTDSDSRLRYGSCVGPSLTEYGVVFFFLFLLYCYGKLVAK
eukprot:SAG25_NODE_76_length_16934_cov_51.463202_7_plen_459_part_00